MGSSSGEVEVWLVARETEMNLDLYLPFVLATFAVKTLPTEWFREFFTRVNFLGRVIHRVV